jgi:hypothetical protein
MSVCLGVGRSPRPMPASSATSKLFVEPEQGTLVSIASSRGLRFQGTRSRGCRRCRACSSRQGMPPRRGLNQVDLFGRPLASILRLPHRPVLFMRGRPRPEKHLLRTEERSEAVRGAFAIREGGRVDNLRVLLLDDVMRTGATLDACARTLREAAAKSVIGLTVARTVRHAIPVAGES